ncbi:MAG: CapA family protein, partial [Coriobacteriales bacterium]|nr:CapA family protein [Coriobacteriales bacterium]
MKQQTRRSIASSRKGAPQVVGVLAVVALLLAFCLPPLLGTVLGLGETTVLPDEATPTGSGVEREDITGSDAEQGAITGAGAEVARTFSPLHQANSLVAQTLEDSWEYRVHFLAVGDNLIDDALSSYADGQAGEMGDGLFDFSPIYAPVAPYVRAADLAYINNETHLWDAVSPRGYPSFNAPEAVAPAVVGAGFDLVASATNHSYDWGFD